MSRSPRSHLTATVLVLSAGHTDLLPGLSTLVVGRAMLDGRPVSIPPGDEIAVRVRYR